MKARKLVGNRQHVIYFWSKNLKSHFKVHSFCMFLLKQVLFPLFFGGKVDFAAIVEANTKRFLRRWILA